MKKLLSQSIYWLNVLGFFGIVAMSIYITYMFINGLLFAATQPYSYGSNIDWIGATGMCLLALIVPPTLAFLFVRELRKRKAQEMLTGSLSFSLGLIGLVVDFVMFVALFLFGAAIVMS